LRALRAKGKGKGGGGGKYNGRDDEIMFCDRQKKKKEGILERGGGSGGGGKAKSTHKKKRCPRGGRRLWGKEVAIRGKASLTTKEKEGIRQPYRKE